jgi:glycosyltransferase involved in cell wall biosynthesis
MSEPGTNEPRVSVLMPAYKASATIAQAVSSALAQSVREIEVIVADDGSPEPIAAALAGIADERLRIVRRPQNGGVSAARNSALELARAPLVAQLDADDHWRADHLEHLLPAFDDPAVGLAYANVEIVGFPASDRWIAERTPDDGLPAWISDRSIHPVNDLGVLYRANPIPAPAVVMRTDAVRAVGGYPEWLRVGEEYLLYLRLRQAGWRFAYVDRRSAVYRWPEPGRGATFNARRNSREETKLFVALALSSPPNAAIFKRLGMELVDLLETHVPASVPLARRLRGAGRALRRR